MLITGKRHDFVADYDVGFDDDGRILGARPDAGRRAAAIRPICPGRSTIARCATSTTPTSSSTSRSSRIAARRNTVSNTAFRGFGGPQGMMVIEHVIDDIARTLGSIRSTCAACNFYGITERNVTPYGQTVEDNVIARDRRRARGEQRLSRSAAARSRAFNAHSADDQARHRAHAGEVRHLVQRDASQPGRRAGARLHRRHGAAEPRRHRDGPGPAHQGRAGRRAPSFGVAVERDPHHRDRHEQGAEHLGDRGIVGPRSQRQGGAGRGAHDHASASIEFAAQQYRRGRRIRCASRTARCTSARRDADVRGTGRARRTPRACRCRPPASTATPKIHYDRSDAHRPAVLLLRLRRGGVRSRDRHADRRERACCASTSCTTSARR